MTERQSDIRHNHESNSRKHYDVKKSVSEHRPGISASNLQLAMNKPASAAPEAILELQRLSGNRAVSQLIQAKLTVGAADDTFEREADQMAVAVTSIPEPAHQDSVSEDGKPAQRQGSAIEENLQGKPLATSISRCIQREEAEEEELVQASPAKQNQPVYSGASFEAGADIEKQVQAQKGSGLPLSADLQGYMGSRFGTDFSQVRVHTDSQAAQLNRSLNAQAFTHGSDIFMGGGRYDPGTPAGKQLLAHELTHTIQQGAVSVHRRIDISTGGAVQKVQRKTLNPNDILNSLTKIPFIAQKLKQTQHLRRDDVKDKAPNVETMLAHIQQVLSAFNKNIRKSDDKNSAQAISLAVVLEGVARIIAVNELNDPFLTPVITMKLIDLYRDEIGTALGKMDEKESVIQLATALTAGDPINLFMHDELRLEEAARQVRKMAMIAGKDPLEFFDLLRQRFEIEMSTQTESSVKASQDTVMSFSVEEASGEISVNYLKKLFPSIAKSKKQPAQANPTWKKGQEKGARKELDFTPEAANKLDKLKTAVGQHDYGFTGENRTWKREGETDTHTLTTRQSAHLAEIEENDASANENDIQAKVMAKLQGMFKINPEQAAILLGQIKTGLANLPLTMTVKASDWFASGAPSSTIFKPSSSRRKETNFSDLFNKSEAKGSIHHLGDFQDTSGQGRPQNYGRFRNWKDQKMSGNRGFKDTELPSFGAVNINWKAHSTDKQYGVNSYGDLHFILNKKNVIDRLVYTATDHGHPHRDIFLAFSDFVLGDDRSKSLTGLKMTESSHVVRQVVNSLITGKLVSTPVQCFEIQIFGELDIAKDVSKIAVAPSTDATLKHNVQNFCATHNIQYEPITDPVETVLNAKWFSPMPNDKGQNLTDQLQNVLNMAILPDPGVFD